jgi:transposase-like protein
VESLVGGEELLKGGDGVVMEKGEGSLMEGVVDGAAAATKVVTRGEKEKVREKGTSNPASLVTSEKDGSSSTYFGKPAREFSIEEKEEVVRYANATTLQKAAIKYGVAAPTVWRWRVELKLHQPKYSAMQKKYIIKFAETNSLKEAAQRYGITGKTIQNWRKALQADGELSGDVNSLLMQESQTDVIESSSQESQSSEVVFHFIVDGGEVVEVTGTVEGNVTDKGDSLEQGAEGEATVQMQAEGSVPLEVTNEVDIENVGMEYDVVSSEGHVAKPRCTPQEKVQILQYALDHSIKEASQKFGVSPGTLYYWKRSRNSGKEGSKESLDIADARSSVPPDQSTAASSPQVNEYSDMPRETNVLASNSGDVFVRPES